MVIFDSYVNVYQRVMGMYGPGQQPPHPPGYGHGPVWAR